jgi:hypothetical protein
VSTDITPLQPAAERYERFLTDARRRNALVEIDGTLTIKPAAMSAMIREAGHKLRVTERGTLAGGDLAVTVIGIRSDDPDFEFVSTWTPHDAVTAGLATSYTPDPNGVWLLESEHEHWMLYAKRMCQWRAIGDVASAGFEDVLMGLHLTPEELGATVDAEGEVIRLPEKPAAPEPTEPWADLIKAAQSADEALAVLDRAKAAGEATDMLRAAAYARAGWFERHTEQAAS